MINNLSENNELLSSDEGYEYPIFLIGLLFFNFNIFMEAFVNYYYYFMPPFVLYTIIALFIKLRIL